jgi:hypothetical protein
MTTTTLNKTTIETTWTAQKIQEETARVLAMQWMTAYQLLSKAGEQYAQEFETTLRQNKVEQYKKLGVKTPIDLVKAMAEFEANLFGSKIEIFGDESKACLTYNQCGMWNAMQKMGKMTPEQEEKMGHHFQNCVSNLAKEFGFKGEVKFEEPCATVTFTK